MKKKAAATSKTSPASAPGSSLPGWVAADLKRSGINDRTAEHAGIVYPAREILDVMGIGDVYALRYPDLSGKFTSFTRYRKHPDNVVDGHKYHQATDTGVHFYFARVASLDWRQVADDASVPIWICEGEKKSLRGCLAGRACLGIGGSSAFTTKKHGDGTQGPSRPIDDFRLIEWQGRKVFVIYDSDYRDKPTVRDDRVRLVSLLLKFGALPFVIDLPPLADGNKCGLDDFLQARNNDKRAVEDLEQSAAPLDEPGFRELAQLNDRYVYVRNEQSVWWIDEGRFIDARKFVTPHLANKAIKQFNSRTGHVEEVPLGSAWLKWQARAECRAVTYLPFGGSDDDPAKKIDQLNTWRDTRPEPVEGDVTPFFDLLKHLEFDGDELRQFVEWCAYPVVNPGKRPLWAVVLVGPQGCGKTFLTELLLSVYGWDRDRPSPNTAVVNGDALHATFNGVLCRKQMVVVNEAAQSDKRTIADKLKSLITDPTIVYHEKYQPAVELPNKAAIVFTTNHTNALKLEHSERRYLVHSCPDKPLHLNATLLARLRRWLEADKLSGPNLRWYFERKVNLREFNPAKPPTWTDAAEAMRDSGFDDVGGVLRDLELNPERFVVRGQVRTMFTMAEVVDFAASRLSGRGIPVTLQRVVNCGVEPFQRLKTGRVRGPQADGPRRQERLWCFKQAHTTLNRLSEKELLQRYDAERAMIKAVEDGGNVVPLRRAAKF